MTIAWQSSPDERYVTFDAKVMTTSDTEATIAPPDSVARLTIHRRRSGPQLAELADQIATK